MRSRLLEVLNEVKPYMAETNVVDRIVEKLLGSAISIDDFIKRIQNEHDQIDGSVLRTDLRIYIGRLRKRIRTQPA